MFLSRTKNVALHIVIDMTDPEQEQEQERGRHDLDKGHCALRHFDLLAVFSARWETLVVICLPPSGCGFCDSKLTCAITTRHSTRTSRT